MHWCIHDGRADGSSCALLGLITSCVATAWTHVLLIRASWGLTASAPTPLQLETTRMSSSHELVRYQDARTHVTCQRRQHLIDCKIERHLASKALRCTQSRFIDVCVAAGRLESSNTRSDNSRTALSGHTSINEKYLARTNRRYTWHLFGMRACCACSHVLVSLRLGV